tara:strand:+ start:2383 stop:2886 length:504 start_codon:yes stop_codon:yes gene_type:complete
MSRNPAAIFSLNAKTKDEEGQETPEASETPSASPTFLGLFAQGIAAGLANSQHPDASNMGAAMGASMEPLTDRMKLDRIVEMERRMAEFDSMEFVSAAPKELEMLAQPPVTAPASNQGIADGVIAGPVEAVTTTSDEPESEPSDIRISEERRQLPVDSPEPQPTPGI